jgi:hypothetical protein
MKKQKLKLNWNNIIRCVSGLVIITSIITLVTVSCQHTEAVEEEPTEATTEIQLDCYKYIEDIPLPEEFQTYINKVAKSYEIAPEIVFAMIERESAYDTTEVGDNGDSEGLMQIQRQWHEERMARLGVTDLFDPYDNVLVGVDYLAELLTKYGDMGMALTAYNTGETGADEYYFSNGIYANEYAEEVLEKSEIFDKGARLMFFRTDDPVKDQMRHDTEQEAELQKMPKCSHCGERIQGGYLFDIEGELYCEEHAYELFRKDTADYVG